MCQRVSSLRRGMLKLMLSCCNVLCGVLVMTVIRLFGVVVLELISLLGHWESAHVFEELVGVEKRIEGRRIGGEGKRIKEIERRKEMSRKGQYNPLLSALQDTLFFLWEVYSVTIQTLLNRRTRSAVTTTILPVSSLCLCSMEFDVS